jgi:hypothetical protein
VGPGSDHSGGGAEKYLDSVCLWMTKPARLSNQLNFRCEVEQL